MTSERYRELKKFLDNLSLPADDDLTLIDGALTHRSYVYEQHKGIDNERLEFLGDAVIGLVAADYLFEKFPQKQEGELSKLKSVLVSRNVLARRGKALNLGDILLLGKGEEKSGGRHRSSLIGSALEALVGALYLTLGFEKTKEFILAEILEPSAEMVKSVTFTDFKSKLQEFCQKTFNTIPSYALTGESGPDHAKVFTVEVTIKGRVYGHGTGIRKKVAENEAARVTLNKLKELKI